MTDDRVSRPDEEFLDSLSSGAGVVRIDDRSELRAVVAEIGASARHEVCSTVPSGPHSDEMMRQSWQADTQLLASGVAGRAIYQADAVRTPSLLRYLTEFVAAGAQARIAVRVDRRVLLVDRRVAVVGLEIDALSVPALVIREPVLVQSVQARFAQQWRAAHSVGVGAEDVLGDAGVREVLLVLAEGLTDEAAARRLGVSDRTIRRRVSAVMDLLGASSRFQAGVKAVRGGWI